MFRKQFAILKITAKPYHFQHFRPKILTIINAGRSEGNRRMNGCRLTFSNSILLQPQTLIHT